jgi:hypothetical protein
LSRLRTFALLAALAVLATAFAACGSSDSSSSSDDPQQVLDSATLEGVESGSLDLSLAIKAEGEEGGDIDISVSGPFQSEGTKDLPQLDLTASANGTAEGDPVDFEGGLTLLSDRAFVNYEGTEYEVDPTTFGFVKSAFEQAQQQGGSEEANPADLSACQKAAEGFKVGDFADRLTNDGSADVDGTSTTKVSGELNVAGAIDAIIKLTEDPACSAQLEAAGPLPIDELEKAKGELTSAVKKAQIDVYVGDDDIIRRVAAELTVEPEGTKGEKVEIDLDLVLSGVNEEQEISAPEDTKPLEILFQKLGINPIELLEGASSGEGLGELLEDIIGSDSPLPFGEGSSSSGGSSSGGSEGSAGGGGQQAYLDCLKEARTPADLQQCANMIQ